MPIYAYRCAACGHAKDVLQKISDPVLTDCPACGAASFQKQVTAAGFQLKGSGWYVTDFQGGAPAAKAAADSPRPPSRRRARRRRRRRAAPAAGGEPRRQPARCARRRRAGRRRPSCACH